ncbi:MAG: BlaI/MecI/CopY family transcriptional regulator [Candidatus Bathyarchaeia archaeon]
MDDTYKETVLKLIWENEEEGVIASQLHKHLKALMKDKAVSRAAILSYLNDLCKQGILNFKEETCRGGRRKRYFPRMSRVDYEKENVRGTLQKLLKSHPKYTIEVLTELLKGGEFDPQVSRALLGYFMVRDELTYHTLEEAIWGSGNPIYRY